MIIFFLASFLILPIFHKNPVIFLLSGFFFFFFKQLFLQRELDETT